MRLRRFPAVFAAGGVSLACAAATTVSPTQAAGPSVLFIGNSLTASNDLAARVAEIAASAGRPLRTSAVTLSGASLADHWEDGRALRAIREGRWDVVALQQGPSTLPESRAELIASTRQFAAEIRRAGGRPALLMVWPLPGQTAAAVSASYRAAAEANDALLLPAGDAWTIAQDRDSVFVLDAGRRVPPERARHLAGRAHRRVHAVPAGPPGAGRGACAASGLRPRRRAGAISSSTPPAVPPRPGG